MPAAHALFAPSAAHRWLRCPGSIRAAEGYPRASSVYAAEGTVAHEIREQCLLLDLEPAEFIGHVMAADGFEFTVDEAMAQALKPGIDRIRSRPGHHVCEMRVNFDPWLPGQFGTLDHGIVAENFIEINDLKYGAGVLVEAEGNEQLMTYALGFWNQVARHRTQARDVCLHIDQPRVAGGGSEWWCTVDDLLAHGERLAEARARALAPDAPRVPGDKQCQWCPAKPDCGALAAFAMEAIAMEFDDLDREETMAPPHPDDLDVAQMCRAAEAAPLVKKWLDAVSARVLEKALAGEATPGLKAVYGARGPRKWRSTAEAQEFLVSEIGEKAFVKRLLTAPEATKAVTSKRRDALEQLMTRAAPKPILVPADDKREAVDMAAQFDDVP